MLRADPRQSHPLRQYGGAAQVLFGRNRRAVALGRPGRQAGRRVHFNGVDARRTGVDASFHDAAIAPSRDVPGRAALHRTGIDRDPERRHAVRRQPYRRGERCGGALGHRTRTCTCLGRARRDIGEPARLRSAARNTQLLSIWLWTALTLSLLAWIGVGYPWPVCVLAVLPLLAPLNGLIKGRRYTYAWATLFAIPYLAFALTELLVNPSARWVASISLFLVFGWFCSMVLFLRASPAHRE